MANNIAVLDGAGASKTIKTTDTATVHVTHHNIDTLPASTNTLEVVGDVAHDAAAAGNPVLLGAYASAAAPTDVSTDADAVRIWALKNGAVATVVTAAGALVGGDAANGLDVDVTRVIPGTSATHLGKAEDAAHTTGDTGVMALGVRTDTPASLGGTDGDYVPPQMDALGAMRVVGRLGITVAPTMGTLTAGAYAAADTIDGKLSLTSAVPVTGGSGIIHRVLVTSKSTQTFSPEVFFFNADPTNSTFADNGVFTVNAADMGKLIGVATCDTVKALGTGSVHQAANVGLGFKLAATTVYAVIVTRAIVTLGSTSDVALLVHILPD